MPPNTNIPDSGTRAQFIAGAVRDAAPGKGLPSNIPPIAIRALAQRFEDGAQRYGPRNWMLGIPLSRYIDAIFRHALAMSEGRTDEDPTGAGALECCGVYVDARGNQVGQVVGGVE